MINLYGTLFLKMHTVYYELKDSHIYIRGLAHEIVDGATGLLSNPIQQVLPHATAGN